METTQFDTLILAITGLNTKIDKLDAKVDSVESRLSARIDKLDAKVDDVIKRLDRVETKLDATFNQLGHTVADVTDHERRLRKLEGFNA
ncbi:MAG: hypothetical protein ACJ763_19975 [Bdellovibrionia bacterium]